MSLSYLIIPSYIKYSVIMGLWQEIPCSYLLIFRNAPSETMKHFCWSIRFRNSRRYWRKLPQYYMHSDIFSMFRFSTLSCVISSTISEAPASEIVEDIEECYLNTVYIVMMSLWSHFISSTTHLVCCPSWRGLFSMVVYLLHLTLLHQCFINIIQNIIS